VGREPTEQEFSEVRRYQKLECRFDELGGFVEDDVNGATERR
jgi:hypothetical protein